MSPPGAASPTVERWIRWTQSHRFLNALLYASSVGLPFLLLGMGEGFLLGVGAVATIATFLAWLLAADRLIAAKLARARLAIIIGAVLVVGTVIGMLSAALGDR